MNERKTKSSVELVKVLAFYLPQYHPIPENDEWWGKGFTEWTNVRKAKSLFKWQTQPKIPLNDNYYDLMDKSVVEWQTDLMHKYGIYGFCYFHYWFNGKKLLEKPAENLLVWKDIDQPFCFAWANATWARTWKANTAGVTDWACDDLDNDGNGVLIKQEYGLQKDWEAHYRYLLPFFMDGRYIRVNNKPMLLIYKVDDIKCSNEMFELWNSLAVKDGFDGIHIVSVNEFSSENKWIDAIAKYSKYGMYDRSIATQSVYTVRMIINKIKNIVMGTHNKPTYVLDYERVWRGFVGEEYGNIKTYPGGVVMYDETPRKGRSACILKGSTPKIFKKYLGLQIEKAKSIGSEFIFLAAWNEWGEGNYLEPDKENGYSYLEAVKSAVEAQ